MTGVDVSRWQEGLDMADVKAAGHDFVIIKAGGSDAGFYTDRCFADFYDAARAAGLYVGAYYFVGPDFKTADDGAADAERFIEILGDRVFDMPVYVDVESTSPADRDGVTDAAIAFCETMEDAGYFCGIYSSEIAGFRDRLDADRLTAYTWWVACWDGEPDIAHPVWQYSDNGSICGHTVDLNICFEDFPGLIHDGCYNNCTFTSAQSVDVASRLRGIRAAVDSLIADVER